MEEDWSSKRTGAEGGLGLEKDWISRRGQKQQEDRSNRRTGAAGTGLEQQKDYSSKDWSGRRTKSAGGLL